MMEGIFDFARLKELLTSDFRFVFDAMNGVTGPYGKKIFEEILGALPARLSMPFRWRILEACTPTPTSFMPNTSLT